MKKFIFFFLSLFVYKVSHSQDNNKKLPSLGIHFMVNDFETAAELRSGSIKDVIKNKQYYKAERKNPGLAISYLEGVGKHIDGAVSVAAGFVDYDVPAAGKAGSSKLFIEAAATGNFKMLSDRRFFNPFLTVGVGAFSYRTSFGAFIPAGVGLQVKLASDVFFVINTQYRIPVTDKAVYHIYQSLGVVAPLVNRKNTLVVPPAPPVVLDRDNDGVPDVDDKCPDIPGLASLLGCPDRDGDGIADADDKCPDVAGLIKYSGCPIPDTDGDGIDDEQDKCITIKGIARYNGCPIPDSDGDGINDEEDKCPSRPGPASNMGCPEISKEVIEKINFAAKNIFFATGSAKLLPKSFKSLDAVAALLGADETLLINIDGYTDSTGKAEKNVILSGSRADAVKTYLINKSVGENRITATGYGPDRPIAPNKTAAGRAKNRRVELNLRNY